MTTQRMTAEPVRLPIPGLPARCPQPDCGRDVAEWRLTVHARQVVTECPHCHVSAVPVAAAGGDPVAGREISDAEALDAIAADLDMSEWDADLIGGIAEVIRQTGRTVRDLDGR